MFFLTPTIKVYYIGTWINEEIIIIMASYVIVIPYNIGWKMFLNSGVMKCPMFTNPLIVSIPEVTDD